MAVMVFVKATEDSETVMLPASDAGDAVDRHNDGLAEAGMMAAARGNAP